MKPNTETHRRSLLLATLMAVLLGFSPWQQSVAADAETLFADGNRLYRNDLYWAALLRYRQAYGSGLDTPVLHFNMGVAYYRSQQFDRAREAFMRSIQSPELLLVSQYNLGLTAWAAGDTDEARDWFGLTRDQRESTEIRKLSGKAIARLEEKKAAADVYLVRVTEREEKRNVTDFTLTAYVGAGSDDNVYRAPGTPYRDYSDPATPVVMPEAISGTFLPVDLRVKYAINSFKFESFYAAYRLIARVYQDEELENANAYSHELSFGSSFRNTSETRDRRIFSGFTFAQHEETLVDRADGTEREYDGELIGDRMSYSRYGPEIAWVQAYERFALGLRVKGQLWNYDDLRAVPEYDHEYFLFAAHAQYKFTSSSLLRLTVDKYSRRFSDRPAFNLDGEQPATNPKLRYDYVALGMTARQRITRNMWFGFNVERTQRQDRYVGYNDYTRDEFGFDFSWAPSPRFKFDLRSAYRSYDYPNAFAFHNQAAGLKTLETVRGNVVGEIRITPRLTLKAEAEFRDSVSSDTRINYDRTWFTVGVTWQQ